MHDAGEKMVGDCLFLGSVCAKTLIREVDDETLLAAVVGLLPVPAAWAAPVEDVAGAKDPAGMPRYAGSVNFGYQYGDHDESDLPLDKAFFKGGKRGFEQTQHVKRRSTPFFAAGRCRGLCGKNPGQTAGTAWTAGLYRLQRRRRGPVAGIGSLGVGGRRDGNPLLRLVDPCCRGVAAALRGTAGLSGGRSAFFRA